MIAASLARAVAPGWVRVRRHLALAGGDELAEVARVAAHGAARDARHPLMRLRTLAALAPELREVVAAESDSGAWVPRALQGWIVRQVQVREPVVLGEQSLAAWITLALGAGDCDCLARAVAAMALTLGLRASVGVYPTGPGLAHAVCAVSPDWSGVGEWVVVDRGPLGLRRADFTRGVWVEAVP